MSIEQQLQDEPAKTPMQPANIGRRRLGKAGIGAAGVLLTLESPMAMATGPKCVAPSAATLSHGGNSNYVERGRCNAVGPEVWCKLSSYWPCSREIKYGELFRCTDGKLAKARVFDILRGYDDPPKNQQRTDYRNHIARAFATTFLNIRSGALTVMTEENLFRMWNDVQAKKVYHPRKDVDWAPYDVHKYLKSTYLG